MSIKEIWQWMTETNMSKRTKPRGKSSYVLIKNQANVNDP